MIYFLKYFRGIAYFLAMLILFQSCAIYKRKPSSFEEAAAPKNIRMKVITKDGNVHYLKWIEEKDGNAYSITNTKRVYVKKKKIYRYIIYRPGRLTVPLDVALKHNETIYIDTQYPGQNGLVGKKHKHSFIDIEDRGDFIRGIKMTGKDTATVIIPIEQIEAINLLNQDLNAGVATLVTLVVIAGSFAILGVSVLPYGS